MNEKTNILSFNPIATDETLIGKRIEDTHWGITWQDFIEVAKAYGFKCGFCQRFAGTGGIEEEEVIFFHEEKGLILYSESFGGKSVNSASVYGEVKIKKLDICQRKALNRCSEYGGNGNGTMYFEVDVRKGLRFYLDAISEAFELSTSWSKVPCLSFLNYMEAKDENYSYEKINEKKIATCVQEVRKIIFG